MIKLTFHTRFKKLHDCEIRSPVYSLLL